MLQRDDIYFLFHLAHELKIGTVKELVRRMSIEEFNDWQAFFARRDLEREQARLMQGG